MFQRFGYGGIKKQYICIKHKNQYRKRENCEGNNISDRFCHMINSPLSRIHHNKQQDDGNEEEKFNDDQYYFCFRYIFLRARCMLRLFHKFFLSVWFDPKQDRTAWWKDFNWLKYIPIANISQ